MAHLFITTRPLPALAESARLRYATFVLMYFSQGIPEGLLILAVPAWLAMNGKSPAVIAGYAAVALLPASLKILLAPMIERFTYLPMGRRRPWLLIGQEGLILSFVGVLLVPDPLNHVSLLAAAVACLLTFEIIQDVATDSLVIDIVPVAEQGRANSLMWGAKAVGRAVALAGGSWLIQRYGLATAVLVGSATVAPVLLAPLLLRERPGEKLLPWLAGATSPAAARMRVEGWGGLWRAVRRVFVLRNSLLMATTLFLGGLGLDYVLTGLPIFTIQGLGWSSVQHSQVYSLAGLTGGVLGMLVGGPLIAWLGTVRLVQLALLAQAGLVAGLGLLPGLWPQAGFVMGFIGCFCLMSVLMQIGLLALAMHCCWQRISALQFTLYMTIINSGSTVGSMLLGYARTHYGWQATLLAFPLLPLAVVGVLQLMRMPVHTQQLTALESAHQEEAETLALRLAV